jgi:hypothetical protein
MPMVQISPFRPVVAGPGICLYWCGTSLYAAGQGFPANHKGRLKEGAIS